ncbi:hypothetical protein [Marinobacter shengliensis]|jgi:hypothetical protein|uniref:hypothetical protein n=1 Tax=Marinobacter shengliensis TaxID=1389223 RepID=UPI002573DA66|nr:hypothetical protein [Marinobacter shengliensis]
MKYSALQATALSGLLLSGCGGSSDSPTIPVQPPQNGGQTPDLTFSAEATGTETRTDWNDGDFSDTRFNLCVAKEPIDSGVENCTSYEGGRYFMDISAPFTVQDMTPGSEYWLRLQAQLPEGQALLSSVKQIKIAADDGTVEPESPGPYAGLGPFTTGTRIQFYELDGATGQRVGSDPVATTTVGDQGSFDMPDVTPRWVEAEVTGDFLDLYNTGGDTEGTPVSLSAIFDTSETNSGHNIQVFTHWVAERVKWLLVNSHAGSLEDALSTARTELEADLALNHPPETISFQLSADDSEPRLDDSAKLLAISSWISRYLDDHALIAESYAQNRLESENDELAQLISDLSNRADFYSDRAFNRMGAQLPSQEAQREYLLLGQSLSGCAAAKAFRTRPTVCLGEGRDTFSADIPGGSGTHQKEIFFHPRQAGMWAVELSLDNTCDVSWTTYLGEDGTFNLMSQSFNGTVGQRLVGTRRLTPQIHRIVANFNREECAATEVDFNFRKVAIGSENPLSRGLYYLTPDSVQTGVVGAYQHTSGTSAAPSSSRSYYFLNHYNDAPATYDFALDYRSTGSGSMTIHVEERIGSNFLGITFVEEEQSPGQLLRSYELKAGTPYRVWVENLNPRTTSVNNFNSYARFNYELTINETP